MNLDILVYLLNRYETASIKTKEKLEDIIDEIVNNSVDEFPYLRNFFV